MRATLVPALRDLSPASAWRWLAALAALFLMARLRAAFVAVLDTDETIFHTVAARMLAGETLYADVYDVKPPGIFLFYALVQAIFGPGLFAVHQVTSLVVAATAWMVARCTREASGDSRAGYFAAAIYLAFHGVGDASTGAASSTEQLAALPVAAAMVLLLRGRSAARALAGGALLGLAALFKPQAGAAGAAALLAILLRGERRLESAAALALGAALPIGATWGVFEAWGLGEPMLRWSFFEGLAYASQGDLRLWRESANLLAFLGLQALPIFLAIQTFRQSLTGFARALVGGWLALALLATAAGGRFYWQYFTLLAVPLAVAAGVWAPSAWDRLGRRLRLAVVVVALLPSLGSQAWLFRQESRGLGSLREGHRELAREALRHLPEGARLVVFGSAAPIYYVTGVFPPTPFVVTDHLFHYLDPNLLEDPEEIRRHADPERLRAFLETLARPEVAVVVDAPFSSWRDYSLTRIPEVASAVRARFRLVYQSERGAVWARPGISP